jgi:hypothetical protein
VSVRRSADASPAGRPPGTRVVWRLWSEPPDLVQTGSGTRLDLLALCPEESEPNPPPFFHGAWSGRDLTTAVC